MELNKLFKIAAEKKASDLHLVVGRPPYLRIDGELEEIPRAPVITAAAMKEMIHASLTKEQLDKFNREKNLDFSVSLSELARFRTNIYFEKNNLALAARAIPPAPPTMKDITMPKVVYELTRFPQGLVLMTGPTGCGKSTSLAAMIELINHERVCQIITLEDPIEYIFTPDKSIISQRQLGLDMNSFVSALKYVLRQDPNVLVVGEMRDLETIAATLTLAETGFLVLATLHTQSAAQTIDRIIDVFPPYQQAQIRLQLSLSLRGVISQRLLPKVGGGRVAAREILVNNPAIANSIREGKVAQIKNIIQTSADQGMFTIDQDIKSLYQKGLINKETAQSFLSHYQQIV